MLGTEWRIFPAVLPESHFAVLTRYRSLRCIVASGGFEVFQSLLVQPHHHAGRLVLDTVFDDGLASQEFFRFGVVMRYMDFAIANNFDAASIARL